MPRGGVRDAEAAIFPPSKLERRLGADASYRAFMREAPHDDAHEAVGTGCHKLDEAAMTMIKKITANSSLSIKLTKRQMNYGVYQDYEQQFEMEAHDVVLCLTGLEAAMRAKAALERTKKK